MNTPQPFVVLVDGKVEFEGKVLMEFNYQGVIVNAEPVVLRVARRMVGPMVIQVLGQSIPCNTDSWHHHRGTTLTFHPGYLSINLSPDFKFPTPTTQKEDIT